MKIRPAYVLLFLFILAANIFDIYTSIRMSSVPEYEPSSPIWLSLVLWVSNTLIVFAAFGAAFRKQIIINLNFWYAIVSLDVMAAFLSLYFEFMAGGYTQSDLLSVSIITFAATCFYLLAPLRYCLDIKELEMEVKN